MSLSEQVDRSTPLKRWSTFFSDFKVIWTVISAIIVGAFFLGSTVEDYKRRFLTVENFVKVLTERFNLIDQKLSVTVSRVAGIEIQREAPKQSSEDESKSPAPNRSDTVNVVGLSGLSGGTPYVDTSCPSGQYVAGIKTSGAPGSVKYCIGCIVSVQAICRDLPK